MADTKKIHFGDKCVEFQVLALLWYRAALIGRYLPTFRDSHSVHSAEVKQSGHISMDRLLLFKSRGSKLFQTRKPFFFDCLTIEDGNNRVSRNVSKHYSTQRNISEDWKLHLHSFYVAAEVSNLVVKFVMRLYNRFRGYLKKFGDSPYIPCIFTPLTRALQKLTLFQLLPKPPAFCGTQNFITAFQMTSHLSLFEQKFSK